MDGPEIKKRQIVGYASGVFDLFHVGHLRILQRAKALCDRLIVGVTVDELVGYKNQKVFVPFDQRLEIISGLKAVDLAIPQDDLDKFVMWKKLKFDVMFIGDDWFETGRFKDYERKLKSVGVKIVYLPYTTGISTSGLKSKLGTAAPRSSPHPRAGRKKRKA
ncbi:MAG: adenylyltransferase/cytidyltransferase family protein [Candidatus Aminicenantes bacterium]|nr:adenylyltransferase/cytidyltransferase family protein [Candidatus Aminicenantes bacterium]